MKFTAMLTRFLLAENHPSMQYSSEHISEISHISFLLSVLEKRIESRTVVARIYQSLVFIVGLCSLMILKPCSPMEFAYSDERNRSYCNLAVVLITPLYRNTFKKLVYYMAFRTFTLICVVHHALEQP